MLLLAYLAIGLISVTLPIFAICVVYLRQEKRDAEIEKKRKVEYLKEKMATLSDKLGEQKSGSKPFAELQTQISYCESELSGLESRVESLTARGAVGKPVVFLSFALMMASIGILYAHQEVSLETSAAIFLSASFSVIFSASAIYRLYRTLENIERASLRATHAVQFLVNFGVLGKKTLEIKSGQNSEIRVGAGTDEEDLEKLVITVFVDPAIKVVRVDTILTTSSRVVGGFPYEGFTMVRFVDEFVHRGTSKAMIFTARTEKKGVYKIPVRVAAKGIDKYKEELELHVV
jgi:hypothetical protein